jgi:glycerate 2-kinase
MSSGPRVLLAPDKFKGTLPASEVAAAVGLGVRGVLPDAETVALPVADGGDGTLDAAMASGYVRVPVTVPGPTGAPVATAYARRGSAAVVEMADTCGLARLPGCAPAPLTASSSGLGEAVRAALEAGCDDVVLGVGGSASTDGGAGMLAALGARLLDVAGRPLPPGGRALADLARLDLTGLHPSVDRTRFVVASDVDNPLLGPAGAATVYGPQKGATPEDLPVLDAALARWADVVAETVGSDVRAVPGAGAAGGVGFAALAVLGGELRPGIDLLLDLVGFDDRLPGSILVVTGEGSLDEQSLRGKAPIGVARRAAAAGVPVVAVCGRRSLSAAALRAAGIDAAYALLDLEPDVDICLRSPGPLLERLGGRIARDWGTPEGRRTLDRS